VCGSAGPVSWTVEGDTQILPVPGEGRFPSPGL
jgi:hypothetical protein